MDGTEGSNSVGRSRLLNAAPPRQGKPFWPKYATSASGFDLAVVPQVLIPADSDASEKYLYAVAASASYNEKATVSAGLFGYESSKANMLEARLLLTPVSPKAGIDVGAVFNLDSENGWYTPVPNDAKFLNEIDVSGFFSIGKTTIRVGYLHLGDKGYSSWINSDIPRIGSGDSSLKQGGLYLETSVAFTEVFNIPTGTASKEAVLVFCAGSLCGLCAFEEDYQRRDAAEEWSLYALQLPGTIAFQCSGHYN